MENNLDYISIGNHIRKYRNALGLSQDELAEAVGISSTHLSHIETANTKLSLPVCASISEVLHVTIDDIIYDKPQEYSKSAEHILSELNSCSPAQLKVLEAVLSGTKQAMIKYM